MNRKLSVKLGMFGACPISLLQDKKVKPNAVKVFIALMSFEGTGVESYPSREKIAERAGLSTPEKVSNAIHNLVETGWVNVIQRGKQQSNIYQCIIQGDVPESVTMPESGMPKTGTTDVPKTGTGDMPESGISIVKDHLKDHLKECVANDSHMVSVISTAKSDEVRAVLGEWVENRKTMKKPVTPLALKKAIKSLNLWYPDSIKKQVACVERAIVGGWQGIFPLNPADAEKTTAAGPRNMSDYITAQEGSSAV